MEVTAVKKITITEQIIDQLAFQITSGKVKPGERLPNERELAQMFDVTRGRIREALRALSIIGLITIKPGGGSFVNENYTSIPEKTISLMYYNEVNNFDEIYKARQLIETEVYLTCFRNITTEKLENLHKRIDEIVIASNNDISNNEFNDLLSDLDLYVGYICENSVYSKLMQTIVTLRKESALKILQDPLSRETAANDRKKIINSFNSKDEKKVKNALNSFYNNALQSFYLK